ncbi:ribosome-associated heat shock protein Hsp15 [Citrobacter braakii]|nr:ribosome-associated heat shock protein Hsp15 [Citrobacter braakii]
MKEKPSTEVRLDKWLWAARFYKTRALAREMVEGGKVHYNGQRSKTEQDCRAERHPHPAPGK